MLFGWLVKVSLKLNFVPEPLRLTINLIDRHLDCKEVCCNECSLWVTLASGSCMKRHSFPTLSTSATSTGHHRHERQGPAPIVLALAFFSTSSKPITTPKISPSSSAAFILDGLTLQAYSLVHFEQSQTAAAATLLQERDDSFCIPGHASSERRTLPSLPTPALC